MERQYNAHFSKRSEQVIILDNGRARSFSLVKAQRFRRGWRVNIAYISASVQNR
jgi:hypothetical protein